MLQYFYDLSYRDLYKSIFEHTAIYEENLKTHNTYHVLTLDFSGISATTYDQIQKAFCQKIKAGINNFMGRYPDFIFEKINQDEDPAQYILDFFMSYRAYSSGRKNLYIMIDEYDNFANNILNSNRSLFKEIAQADGFVKGFYDQIKDATKALVAKTFITGVSSISLDSLTSGFNIAENITTYSEFNEYAGFTELELRELVTKLLNLDELNIDLDLLIAKMKFAYNGYSFSEVASEKLFNSSMCLNFIKKIQKAKILLDADQVIDPACSYDKTKLHDLLNHTDRETLERIQDVYLNSGKFYISDLAESININQIESYDYRTAVSILYYLGYLTIEQAKISVGGITLVCPNKVIHKIFRQCFYTYFIAPEDHTEPKRLNVDCFIKGQSDLSMFIESCESYLGSRLNNQHLRSMIEPYLVGIIKTKLENYGDFITYDEYAVQIPKVGERFIDLCIYSKTADQYYILEFKYLSKTKYEANTNTKELESIRDQAKNQIEIYKKADVFHNKKLHAYVLIFVNVNVCYKSKYKKA